MIKKTRKIKILLILMIAIITIVSYFSASTADSGSNLKDWMGLADGSIDGMSDEVMQNVIDAMKRGIESGDHSDEWTDNGEKPLYQYENAYCADPAEGNHPRGSHEFKIFGVVDIHGGQTDIYGRSGTIMGSTDPMWSEFAYTMSNRVDSYHNNTMQNYVYHMLSNEWASSADLNKTMPWLKNFNGEPMGLPNALKDINEEAKQYANFQSQLGDNQDVGQQEGGDSTTVGPFCYTGNENLTFNSGSTSGSFTLVTERGEFQCNSSEDAKKYLQPGDEFSVKVDNDNINSDQVSCSCSPSCPSGCSGNSQGGNTSISFESTSYNARIYIFGDVNYWRQCRIVVCTEPSTEKIEIPLGKTCNCQHDTPPPPEQEQEKPEDPFLKIEKWDAAGGMLSGANLQIQIDDTYTITGTSKDDWFVNFKSILENDGELVGELSSVALNNAEKLFNKEYFEGRDPDKERVELNDTGVKQYVTKITADSLEEAVKETGTYKSMESVADSNKSGHDTYVEAENSRNALDKPDLPEKETPDKEKYKNEDGTYDNTAYQAAVDTANQDYQKAMETYNEEKADYDEDYAYYTGIMTEHQKEYNTYNQATSAMSAAESWARAFANTYPTDTDMLQKWLGDTKIDTADLSGSDFSGIIDGTTYTISKDDLDPKYGYSAYQFYQNCPDAVTTKDLARVYTGDLRIKITELSAPGGYVKWAHANTKSITVKYDGGDITNPLDIFANGGTYLDNTNDEVEVEHEASEDEPCDGTYQMTVLKCYNEQDKVVFDFQKYRELTSSEPTLGASFTITVTATETYWDGSSNSTSITLSTSDGHASCTFSQLGIDVISRWKGTISVNITENSTNPNYLQWKRPKSATATYWWGSITGVSESEGSGEDAIVGSGSGITFSVSGYDTPKDAPQIVIQKNDFEGSALKGAVFNANVSSSTGGSVSLSNLTTNDAGQIIIYANDLDPLGIDVINRWSGTLTLTLKEIKAPEGYRLIDHDIVVTIQYSEGQISSMSCSDPVVSVSPYQTSYTDNDGYNGIAPSGAVTVHDSTDARIKIRKVNGNTLCEEFLTGASFEATVTSKSNDGRTVGPVSTTGAVDKDGYLDITDLAKQVAGDLGNYTGSINVKIRETVAPTGWIRILETLDVTLEYTHGYLTGVTYGDNISKAIVDVGESEDKSTVTLAVKNTNEVNLEPIYISKVDSQTGLPLRNVSFNITIGTEEAANSSRTNAYTTNNDGIIAITEELLNDAGVPDKYTGTIYVLIEEIASKTGYKNLAGEIYLRIEYQNGLIENVEKLKGNCDLSYVEIDGAHVLKATVQNERQIPDLVISKETLSNNNANIINTANLSITIEANGRTTMKSGTVDTNGKITFTGEELENSLGINGTYSGDIRIVVRETSAYGGTVVLPEEVIIVVTLENGRYINGTVSNPVHASIVNNDNEIILKILDTQWRRKQIVFGGNVWEELSEGKEHGSMIDGKFTKWSATERFDSMLEGIEVTLYQIVNGNLEFVKVTEGTNPTFTDSKGHYEFQVTGYATDKYIVKFTYNGQVFTPTYGDNINVNPFTDLETWKITSKASEYIGNSSTSGSRQYVNNMLSEIGSYPANYEVSRPVFSNTSYLVSEGGKYYNIAYRYDELEELYRQIATEMKEYVGEHYYITAREERAKVYENVVNNYYTENGVLTDNEIYNKLQYVEDTRVDAYAGYYTKASGINNPLVDVGTYPHTGNTEDKDFYEEQQYINLGLYKRDVADLSLYKDLDSAIISINGHDETYKFGTGDGIYNQYIYEEDYNYSIAPNSDGTAFYQNDEIELYLKYKITVTNNSKTPTKITEIVDYFDYRFGYNDSYTTTSGAKIDGISYIKAGGNTYTAIPVLGTKYISASEIGLNPVDGVSTTKYTRMYVTFEDGKEPELQEGETLEVYVTIKLGKDDTNKVKSTYQNGTRTAKETLQDFLKDNGILTALNYAEVNGYKTGEGNLDKNSKPGTFNVNEYEKALEEYRNAYNALKNDRKNKDLALKYADATLNKQKVSQDDAWGVEVDISNNLVSGNDSRYYHRTMTGNVWEAISNEVKTSTDLYNSNLLQYIGNNGIEGIIVELVELENETDQVVRARTITDANGAYEFRNYIPGDYAVRFTYGATENSNYTPDQNSKISNTTKTARNEANGIYGLNGQYYQSTKGNPNTDKVTYWYAKYAGSESNPEYEASTTGVTGNTNIERYSDAYDAVTSRIKQIESKTTGDATQVKNGESKANVDSSWSWNYEWDGVEKIQTGEHIDKVEAYTSTMVVEVEYTQREVKGNMGYDKYRYVISDVDFGLTPRAKADMLLEDYVSNIKIILQGGTEQLNVDFDKQGNMTFKNNAEYQNIVIPHDETQTYLDGLIEILMDTGLLNGATLEITYTTSVTNTGEKNAITYFYELGSDSNLPVALSYYYGNGESLENLISFESDMENPVITHDTDNEKYRRVNCDNTPNTINVRTRATNIVDYVDPNLNFTNKDYLGNDINSDWETTDHSKFNSTRENDVGTAGAIMQKYNNFVRAVGGETYGSYLEYIEKVRRNGDINYAEGTNSSVLYTPLLPGESRETKLVLTKVLETSSTQTNDWEFSNLQEVVKLENYAGRELEMEGYDITGESRKESSEITRPIASITDPMYKSMGTAKSATINVHEPTGLSASDEFKTNLWIVLISLVILSGGIVLIKKFVVKSKKD